MSYDTDSMLPPPSLPPLNFSNIQGDIVPGLLKKTETVIFFQIDEDVTTFRDRLSKLVPLITTTAEVVQQRAAVAQHKKACAAEGKPVSNLEIAGIQIAFSQSGLNKIGITENIKDHDFVAGQLADAEHLGDEGTGTGPTFVPHWNSAFKSPVHGMIIVAGDSPSTVRKSVAEINEIFCVGSYDASIYEVLRVSGAVRPGAEKGHEHFGFLDGISEPAVDGFDTKLLPGQELVRQGIIFLGRWGDDIPRPAWAIDGSFLAFRYLYQLVPEFDDFLAKNPLGRDQGIPPEYGSALLGARLVGRWKSGAPIPLYPFEDDPDAGADPQRNNKFIFDVDSQDACPYAAHIRKTYPRNDLDSTERFRIIRRGIPFGPEVTQGEKSDKKTHHGRGLLFRCYQSNLSNGFQFMQTDWANAPAFPKKEGPKPGIDPIIGQATTRSMSGTDYRNTSKMLAFPEFVVSRGGEYFFSPSISALRDVFALPNYVPYRVV